LPALGGDQRRSVSRRSPGEGVRPADGLHQMRHGRRRRPAELERAEQVDMSATRYRNQRPFLPERDAADRRPRSQRSPQIIHFKIERVDMARRRGCVLASLFALAVVLLIPSASRADVIGTCSCKSANCKTSSLIRAKDLTALRAQCHARLGGHGVVSRVRRPR
jgi:hypothetical protein